MPEEATGVLEAPAAGTARRARRAPEWLCCLTCGRRIARAGDAVSFDAGHRHRFRNPHALEFRIGLYADAPGCVHSGEATEFFSWFPGYAWTVAHCAGCRTHLGWHFRCIGPPGPGEPAGFHGLIVDRLRPHSGPPSAG